MDDLDRLYHRLLDAVREGAPHLRERRFRLGDIPQHLLPYRLHRRDLGFEGVQQYERALARLAAGERGYLSAEASVQQAFRRAVDDGGSTGSALGGTSDSAVAQALRTYGDALVALAPAGRTADAAPEAGGPPMHASTVDVPATPASGTGAPAASGALVGGTSADPFATVAIGTDGGRPNGAPPDSADAQGTGRVPAEERRGGGLEIPITRVGPAGDGASSAAAGPVPPPAAPDALPPADSAMPFPVRPPVPVQGGRCPHCGRPLPAERAVTFCPYCGENLTVRRCPACSTELETGWRFCITCGREVDDPVPAGAAGGGA